MQKPDPEKKPAILSAARSRFYRYGIRKTTMQEIAGDVGIAVGTLYLYFKNKEEILGACTEAFEQRHRQKAESILATSASPEEKLRCYVTARFQIAKETREGSDHAAEIARSVLRLWPERLQAESALMMKTVASILQQGIEAKRFYVRDLNRDVEVFLYAIAYFYPVAGKEPQYELTEDAIAQHRGVVSGTMGKALKLRTCHSKPSKNLSYC